jgi:hypothetical protein
MKKTQINFNYQAHSEQNFKLQSSISLMMRMRRMMRMI